MDSAPVIEVVEALYDFSAESEFELSFKAGEVLNVIDKDVGQGWWKARNKESKIGNIPKDFVKIKEQPPIPLLDGTVDSFDVTLQPDLPPAVDPWTRSWTSIPPRPNAPVGAHKQSTADSDFDDDFDDELNTTGSILYPSVNTVADDLPPPPTAAAAAAAAAVKQYPVSTPLRSVGKTVDSQKQASATGSTVPTAKMTSAAHTLKAMLFDKNGIEHYLLNGYKGTPAHQSEIIYIVKNPNDGRLEWQSSDRNWEPSEYQITATNEASKLAGLKQFTVYQIAKEGGRCVSRRFKQFDWLYDLLNDKFRIISIAGLPDKQVTGRFEQDFIEERKIQLQLWLNRVTRHPVLASSSLVSNFLSKDLQYNSNTSIKEWKKYKREAEKDPFRGLHWFACINASDSVPFAETDIKVDSFVRFLASFDRANFNLQNIFLKFNEFNGAMKREFLRIASGFHEMAKTFMADENRERGSRELAAINQETSKAYTKMAESLSELSTTPLHKIYYFLRLYSTLNSSFSNVFTLQRELREAVSGIQQKNLPDIQHVSERAQIINAGVLAEITLLDRQRLHDYKSSLKHFLSSQKKLYREMADRIEKVESSISIDY
ncbi:hypothetical protein ACOME3_002199 [Neoechinorhynchus agilis]